MICETSKNITTKLAEENLYERLDILPDASNHEVKAAYQRKIRKVHPDKNFEMSQAEAAAINAAYEVLKEERSRQIYDLTLQKLESSLSCSYYTSTTCSWLKLETEPAHSAVNDTIDLCDMHFNDAADSYSYDCRCGGFYTLEAALIRANLGQTVLQCDGCSQRIMLIYGEEESTSLYRFKGRQNNLLYTSSSEF